MTRKRAAELARAARQHGYHQKPDGFMYVFCPICRERVGAPYWMWSKKSRMAQLDAGVVEHMQDAHAEA